MNNPVLWKALGGALIATTFVYFLLGLFTYTVMGLWLPIIMLLLSFAATLTISKYYPHVGMLKAIGLACGTLVFVIWTIAITATHFSHRSPAVIPAHTQNSTTKSMTALQIMDQMKTAYRTCTSYSDTGRYETGLNNGSFKTAFIRPDRFRFEYQSDNLLSHYLVWGKGNQAEFRSAVPFESTRMRLDEAVASATGVSEETAHMIPCLLLKKELGGYSVDDMTGIHRLSDAVIDGQDCYCIAGKRLGDQTTVTTLWLEKRTFLIRRIDEGGMVMTYQPIVNGKITEQALRTDW